MYIPVAVILALTVVQVVTEFAQQQSGVKFDNTVMFVLGAVQLAITTILGFQRAAANTVRKLRGKPTLA